MKTSMYKRFAITLVGLTLSILINTALVTAHCDTMDGPVVADAKMAFEKNNVNYVLKWVKPEYESKIKTTFQQVMKVRSLNADAKDLAEKYFYDLLVRLHRAGEGVPFTGVKPAGTPVDEKIKAADLSVDKNDFSYVNSIVPKEKSAHAKELFDRTINLKNFNADDVKAGRDYVEAYVQYFHFIESGEEAHACEHNIHGEGKHEEGDHENHLDHIVRFLSVVFLLTTVFFAILYMKARKQPD